MHNLSHAFSDIERKGPSRNTDTRLGEHGHVGLHKDFSVTNSRDDFGQVVAMHAERAALSIIWDRSGTHLKMLSRFA
jgi:hypothetical protein